MLPDGKIAEWLDTSVCLCSLGGQYALWTRTAYTIELRSIGQRGFLVVLLLSGQNR